MMMLLAAAALAASPSAGALPASRAVAQARATVRIVRAVRVSFDGRPADDLPPARRSKIGTADGPRTAQLIEFE
jgi:hypothetical protein